MSSLLCDNFCTTFHFVVQDPAMTFALSLSLTSAKRVFVTTVDWRTRFGMFTFPVCLKCLTDFRITDIAGTGRLRYLQHRLVAVSLEVTECKEILGRKICPLSSHKAILLKPAVTGVVSLFRFLLLYKITVNTFTVSGRSEKMQ